MVSDYEKEIQEYLAKGKQITKLPMVVSYEVLLAQREDNNPIVWQPARKQKPSLIEKNPEKEKLSTLQQDLTAVWETPEYQPADDEQYQ